MDVIMFLYRILALLVAVGCAVEILTQRRLRDQLVAAMVLVPLLLRFLLVK
ncbi:MAG TPA: hypothetical protein VIK98_01140 [Limnochordales bacterium]